jgi:hypothetical protein
VTRIEKEPIAMLALTPEEPPHELADRAGDGFVVTLNWNGDRDGRLWVSVVHEDTGEPFVVEAASDNALGVYYHPFAYCMPQAA